LGQALPGGLSCEGRQLTVESRQFRKCFGLGRIRFAEIREIGFSCGPPDLACAPSETNSHDKPSGTFETCKLSLSTVNLWKPAERGVEATRS